MNVSSAHASCRNCSCPPPKRKRGSPLVGRRDRDERVGGRPYRLSNKFCVIRRTSRHRRYRNGRRPKVFGTAHRRVNRHSRVRGGPAATWDRFHVEAPLVKLISSVTPVDRSGVGGFYWGRRGRCGRVVRGDVFLFGFWLSVWFLAFGLEAVGSFSLSPPLPSPTFYRFPKRPLFSRCSPRGSLSAYTSTLCSGTGKTRSRTKREVPSILYLSSECTTCTPGPSVSGLSTRS